MRINKFIAESGVASRRSADKLIMEGSVKINGKVCNLGDEVRVGVDTVSVQGRIINVAKTYEYYIMNKPKGYICSAKDDKGRKTVLDLMPPTSRRVFPVGRLDYDTTGALILTNDGEFANMMMHPSNNIDKVYVAKIKGILSPSEQMQLKNGVVIDGFKTSKAKVKVKKIDKANNTSIVELTIHEGKNHQVKKMFEAIGFKVLKLKRESIAFLTLDGVKPGEYRPLSIKEVKKLYGEKNNQD